ncbi:MAG: patatin-like phospholipase family protein [Prevotella sp.]|nr:patatin-like phospholipase family protein [Prevotella sp.]
MKNILFCLVAVLALTVAACSNSKRTAGGRDDDADKDYEQPPLGLVLGGGGAKAAAEIGVLKWIDEQGIEISHIAGSSMGAVIGGLYAAGFTAEEIEKMWYEEDWLSLFRTSAIGSNNGGRTIFGLVKGEEFEEQLRRKLAEKGCQSFADTKIPFCCTVTSIVDDEWIKGEVLDKGDLARGIRASMTFPAPLAYRPFMHQGMRLADGGMTNNLPVDVLKERGMERVIAVDLEVRQYDPTVNSIVKFFVGLLRNNPWADLVLSVTDTKWLATWFDQRPDVGRHERNLQLTDVLLNPELKGYGITSFDSKSAHQMVLEGWDTANKHRRKIERLLTP